MPWYGENKLGSMQEEIDHWRQRALDAEAELAAARAALEETSRPVAPPPAPRGVGAWLARVWRWAGGGRGVGG